MKALADDNPNVAEMKFFFHSAAIILDKQEGHDGPVSLHWLILGNLFKTEDPEEGLKLVAMSSNKKISKYVTK